MSRAQAGQHSEMDGQTGNSKVIPKCHPVSAEDTQKKMLLNFISL